MRRSLVLLTTLLMAGSSLSLHAQSALATTTTLAVGPSNSVAFEQPVTLTATITDSNSAAVLHGTVTFYDGTTALGTAYIISNGSAGFTPGTAIFRTHSLAQAAHSLTATFNGTKADQKSTSAAQSVTISAAAGPYPSGVNLTSMNSATSAGFELYGQLGGFGPGSPTGSVTYNDVTAGTSIGTSNPISTRVEGALTSTYGLGLPPLQGFNFWYCDAQVATGDFNNDGNVDVVTITGAQSNSIACGSGNVTLTTWLGGGNSTFTGLPPAMFPAWDGQYFLTQPTPILVADFNGDGNLDLLLPNADTSGDTILLLGKGDGTFQSPELLSTGMLAGSANSPMVTADFNGDGVPDLAVASGSTVGIYLGNGDGTFTAGGTFSTGFSVAQMTAGDVNNDGSVDLVMAGRTSVSTTGDSLAVALGNGTGAFQSPIVYTPPTSFPGGQPSGTTSLVVANLTNTSGPPQVLWGTDEQLSVVFWSGASSTGTGYFFSGATFPSLAVGDFTFSGNPSVAAYNPNSGVVYIFPGNGDGTLGAHYQTGFATTSELEAPFATGDFRNIGDTDLATITVASSASPNAPVGGLLSTLEPATVANHTIENVTVCPPDLVTATYSGDSNFAPSTSPAINIGAGLAPALSVTGQPATINTGTPFTVTATAGPTCSAGTAPTGNITFDLYSYENLGPGGYEFGPDLGTFGQGTLNGNPATASASVNTTSQPMPVGTYLLAANYSGDGNWPSGTGSTGSFIITGSTSLTISYGGASTIASGTPISITGQISTNQTGPTLTGTVTLLDNGAAIDSLTLGGVPSPFALGFTVNKTSKPFPAGANVLSLSYSGDTNWGASTSSSVTVTATVTDSAVLTSNLPSSLMALTGVSLQFTSVVAPIGSSTVPTGTVQFYDGTAAIGAPVTLAAGAASYTSTAFTAGSHSLSAKYTGDSNYPAATSNAIAFTVVTPPGTAYPYLSTNGALASGGFLAGYTIQVQALVGSSTAGPAPTGSVTVATSTGTTLASGSLTAGCKAGVLPGAAACSSASLAITPPLGSYTLNTSYGGDSNWKAATTTSQLTYQSVQGQPSISVFACPTYTTPQVGSSFGCGVTVDWTWYYPVAVSGTFEILDNGNVFETLTNTLGPAIDGSVNFPITLNTATQPLTPGTHVLSVKYLGNISWLGATSYTQSMTINANVPGFALTSNLGTYSSVVQGTPVTFTAAATAINKLPTPTGTVQFYIDGSAAGSSVTMTGGVASYTTSSLTSGSHTITASYSGDNLYSATTTNGSVVIVPQGPDALAMTVSAPSSVPLGATIPITGTLTVGAYGPTPTGNVALLDGTTSIATAALSGKSPYALSFSVNTASSPLAPGAHSFSLKYAGSTQWAASASTAAAVTVSQALTTTAVTSSDATANAGASVTLTATVSSALTGSAPTGTVQFFDGTTALGSPVTLSNNTATYTSTSLAAGAHSITAVYSGSTDFAGSTSAAFTETIQSIALSSAAITGTVSPGQSASYTLTVTADGVNESTSFACSSLPKGAACSLNPQTVSGSGTTTLTITTTGSSAAAVPNPLKLWTVRGAPVLACVVLLIAPSRRRKQLLFLVLFAVIPALTVGCGGGGGGGCGTNCGSGNATPAGTYTIKVTSTTGSGSSAITAKTTVTLTVQ